jgi:prepilin-type N-terminal cleavage/methylation domain-containing protein
MKRSQKGFTLVEIAIVLVIIGLLLGGMLKGQELIVQGKIKSVANDLNGISTALYAYQDRYRKLPGDDNQAAERWSGKTTAGNGDGAIGPGGVAAMLNCAATENSASENCLFWQHLRLSGLIVGDASNATSPQNGAGGILQVQQGALGLSGIVICASGLSGKIAGALDAQLDDGKPATGQLRATSAANALSNLKEGETAYVEDEGTSYVVCKQA